MRRRSRLLTAAQEAKGLEGQHGDEFKIGYSKGGYTVLRATFSPNDFEKPEFSQRTIRQRNANFAAGAFVVKIYEVKP